MLSKINQAIENVIEYAIFFSRWLQAPVYLGLIIGTLLYSYKFMHELVLLINGIDSFSEIEVMLILLVLVDASMVMNLMIIVIIGGYSIFTSKLDLDGKEDKPLWLDNLDADRLKVKLSTSLASISGVHLLKTFIDIHAQTRTSELINLKFEMAIHLVFIVSAIALAHIARLLDVKSNG